MQSLGYNPIIAQHLSNSNRRTTYLSNKVQNEFICLLGNSVRSKIISNIKEAKYYSIIFYSTPDISHKEQMCQIVRYEVESNDKYTIEESFVDFISTTKKTGQGLAEEILKKLSEDGLEFKNCRGQGYDNSANMAGKIKDVQARLQEINKHAQFYPCTAHSLNLVGAHAARVSVRMVTFFGTVQGIFNFFSNSTARWNIVSSFLNCTLKSHSDTRWESKYNAVHSLVTQLKYVIQALKPISENSEFGDGVSGAQSLLSLINIEFIYLLVMWDLMLNRVHRVNITLQKSNISIDNASKIVMGLKNSLEGMRNEGFENIKLLAYNMYVMKLKFQQYLNRKDHKK